MPEVKEYEMLMQALQAIERGYHPLLVYLMFNVFVLNHNGVSIDVDGCVVCGSTQVVSISLQDGGFLCEEHLGRHQVYSIDMLKAFRHLHKVSFDRIDLLRIDELILKQLIPIMDYYIEEYTGISLRTKTFIQQIV